jgi:hypothetical protein
MERLLGVGGYFVRRPTRRHCARGTATDWAWTPMRTAGGRCRVWVDSEGSPILRAIESSSGSALDCPNDTDARCL